MAAIYSCPRCNSTILYDRQEREWRCLGCGRAFASQGAPKPPVAHQEPIRDAYLSVPDPDSLEGMAP